MPEPGTNMPAQMPDGASGPSPENRLRLLVVNADDFGWSRSVNEGIIGTHRTGIVTRASLLATGRAFEDGVERALATPTLALGVHLEMYRDRPVLPVDAVSSLVGADGMFLGSSRAIIRGLMSNSFDLEQLESEFRAQIERVRDAGIKPSHVDSEKHLHMWPAVFEIVCRLTKEFDIPYIRIVQEPPGVHLIPMGLSVLSLRNRRIARAHGLKTSNQTIGVTESPVDQTSLSRLLSSGRGQCVELVVHPGHVDEEFWRIQAELPNNLTYEREEQYKVLARPEAVVLVEQFGFELVQSGT